MLFENLDDKIKEKIYIIDTLILMANKRYIKNIENIKKICIQYNIKKIHCACFTIKIHKFNNSIEKSYFCYDIGYYKDETIYEILFKEYNKTCSYTNK
jgi:hypothetical protein